MIFKWFQNSNLKSALFLQSFSITFYTRFLYMTITPASWIVKLEICNRYMKVFLFQVSLQRETLAAVDTMRSNFPRAAVWVLKSIRSIIKKENQSSVFSVPKLSRFLCFTWNLIQKMIWEQFMFSFTAVIFLYFESDSPICSLSHTLISFQNILFEHSFSRLKRPNVFSPNVAVSDQKEIGLSFMISTLWVRIT